MRPSRTATACRSSTAPAGSTGTTQRALIRTRSVMQTQSPARGGASASGCGPRLAAGAKHLDFGAPVGREAGDQRLAVLLIGANRHRQRGAHVGLAVPGGFDLGAVRPLLD